MIRETLYFSSPLENAENCAPAKTTGTHGGDPRQSSPSPKSMEAGSRVVLLPCSQGGGGGGEESMRVFREGIELAINFCRAIQFNVIYGYLGSEPHLRIHNLCDLIFSCFIQSPPTKIAFKELLRSFIQFPDSLLDSIQEVFDELLTMYQECLRGDFSSVQIMKEAHACRQMLKLVNNFEIQDNPAIEKIKEDNRILYDIQDPYARRVFSMKQAKLRVRRYMRENQQKRARNSSALIQEERAVCKVGTETPSLEKANSSKMDGSIVVQGDLMRAFKEGVNLFIGNYWQHFGVKKKCGSPTPMLQYLADIIFFWFTQTIKPLSFDHIERILKNEMVCLPFSGVIYKEVTKKLMVMYEECLQGNFSSVDILREESLSRASSSDETTGE